MNPMGSVQAHHYAQNLIVMIMTVTAAGDGNGDGDGEAGGEVGGDAGGIEEGWSG